MITINGNSSNAIEDIAGYDQAPAALFKKQPSKPVKLYGALFATTFLMGIFAGLYLVRSAAETDIVTPDDFTQLDILNQIVAESVEQLGVTKTQSLDLISPSPDWADQRAAVRPPADRPQSVAEPGDITSIMPDLIEPIEAKAATPEQAEETVQTGVADVVEPPAIIAAVPADLDVAQLEKAALAGDYTVEVQEDNGIRHLVLRLTNFEFSREAQKNLLQAAEENGEITFPEGSTIANGKVDLDTMLFNLVQSRLVSNGTPEGVRAAREMTQRALLASGRRITTASN